MSARVHAHHIHNADTCEVDLPPFVRPLCPTSLAAAVVPVDDQGHALSTIPSPTILIIGCNRDKVNSIPTARAYTTDLCRELVHRLQACHKDKGINLFVAYRSELSNDSQRRQVQIPRVEDGKKLDNSIIDDRLMSAPNECGLIIAL